MTRLKGYDRDMGKDEKALQLVYTIVKEFKVA
jgi:hypothetical protein